MKDSVLVIENNQYIIYGYEKNIVVRRKATDEEIKNMSIEETNGDLHLFMLSHYIGFNPSADSEFNLDILDQLTDPLDEELLKLMLERMLNNEGNLDIRTINRHNARRINQVPINTYEMSLVEAEMFINGLTGINNWTTKLKDSGLKQDTINNLINNKELVIKLILSFHNNKPIDESIINKKDYELLLDYHNKNSDLRYEHIGADLFDDKRYSVRIYLNIKNQKILAEFLKLYAQLCNVYKINYNMKGIYKPVDIDENDMGILYLNPDDLTLRIRIIERIINDHPDWIKEFGEPPLNCSRFGTGIYGIAHGGGTSDVSNPYNIIQTYNDFFDHVVLVAYYRLLATSIKLSHYKFKDDEERNTVHSLLNPETIDFGESISNIPTAMNFNNIKFSKHKGIIDRIISDEDIRAKVISNLKNETLFLELFKHYINQTHNTTQGYDINRKSNVALSSFMEKYFEQLKERKRGSSRII